MVGEVACDLASGGRCGGQEVEDDVEVECVVGSVWGFVGPSMWKRVVEFESL